MAAEIKELREHMAEVAGRTFKKFIYTDRINVPNLPRRCYRKGVLLVYRVGMERIALSFGAVAGKADYITTCCS